ncbi:hypothetical protein KP78_35800 [Jeotgalibacillus soli]|uniref:Uncharacterized protein n=1 Tax=Jeotgalibacillus soli TaxID=889306 RepID=A0A0C2VJE9_9BACL|nr:hypothetical protein KP78_35800 [Jeotgalibacillus soli]
MTPEEIKGKIQQSRKEFTKVVEAEENHFLTKKSFKHPNFGSISLKQ